MQLPEQLVEQFRTVAQERLDRIEGAWGQMLVAYRDEAGALLHREIHTLKGESRILGFTDINLVCHKLEDLVEVARARGYAVDEDFDLAVHMALRFMGMLVRKRVGSQLAGIDLPGFVRQIDQILNETRPEIAIGRSRTGGIPANKPPTRAVRVPAALRERLGPIAVEAFVEYATAARGRRRDRLRTSWHALREMIGLQRAIVGADQLTKHATGARTLAHDLGKQVAVTFEPGTTEVTTEVLAAIDLAVLHLVRNAVDHGIEAPAARTAAGKPAAGRIRIGGGMRDGAFVLVVEDDGRGIQRDRVRARAVELGMVGEATVENLELDKLVDLICQPGFSTRTAASEVSGRGIGLDAARAAVGELGGSLGADSELGRGTIWTVTVPVPAMTVQGSIVRVAGVPFPLVIEDAWRPGADAGAPILDVAEALGLGTSTIGHRVAFRKGDRTFALIVEQSAPPAPVRRLIATPSDAIGEVVLIDSHEALLVRPERL